MALDSYKRRAIDIVSEKDYIEGTDKEGLYGKGSTVSNKKDLSSYDYLQMKEYFEIDGNDIFDAEEDPFVKKMLSKFDAEGIGKATINVPTTDKKIAESQDKKMEPLDKEIYEKISGDISKEDQKYQEDAEAEYERLLKEVEG